MFCSFRVVTQGLIYFFALTQTSEFEHFVPISQTCPTSLHALFRDMTLEFRGEYEAHITK